MGCSGCRHRYNPGSPGPTVNRVAMRQGRVVGRYRIKRLVIPTPAPTIPVVPAVVVPTTKGTK